MFARRAPKLIENGWTSLIPLRGKIPLVTGWSRFNCEPPGEALIEQWSEQFRDAGIGLAFGPDHVICVDLDWSDTATARRAYELTIEICGLSDFTRIGRPPKSMLFYCSAPGLLVPGKAFGGYEIFSTSGQAVLFGTHPDTGQPYHWPNRSPENGGPAELPVLTQAALDALQKALEPFCHQAAPRQRNPGQQTSRDAADGVRTRASDRTNGRAALWLRIFRNSPDQSPLDLCRAGVSAAQPGDRYPTAFGAVVALVMFGHTDTEICASVIAPYSTLFDQHQAPRRVAAMRSALKWARASVGPDAATIEQIISAARIAEHWHRRWRRA
jgi:Bifunctional DNA primase/polymerase, N-terminal